MAEVLILTQFFPPETGAGARRVGGIALALASGHDVTVITPNPGYPSPDLFDSRVTLGVDEAFPGSLVRAPRFNPYSQSLIMRGLRETWMAFGLALRSIGVRCDVLIVSTPSMFLAPFAWLLARAGGSRFVWDLRDLTWRYTTESITPSRVQRVLAAAIERVMIMILRRTDLVVTTAEGASQELAEKYQVDARHLRTMRNGVSQAFWRAFDQSEVELLAHPTVLYLGLLGHNHGIDVLVDAARLVPEVRFVIIGDGTERDWIAHKIKEMNLTNVELRGYVVGEEEIIKAYAESDILFNHSKDRPVLNQTMIPAKFPEYMATGRPIVYAGKGISADVISTVGCGVVCPPGDARAIASAIHTLLGDPSAMAAMGRAGREHVRLHFIREDLCRKLVHELEERELLSDRRSDR